MTQPLTFAPTLPEPGSHIVALLERHRERHPYLDEELRRHEVLTAAMVTHRRQADQALAAYQSALARRWSAEVAALRALRAAQRLLAEPAGDPSPLSRAPAGAESTPAGLLQEVRRRADALGLLVPDAPAAEARSRLLATGDALEAAITGCDACEAERRRLVSEQRLMARMLQRSSERARQLLASHVFEGL
jgi:hypothetical protein